MKVVTLFLIASVGSTTAFSTAHQPRVTATSSSSTTLLHATTHPRRAFLETAAAALLLGPAMASAEPRPMYLTEPTSEFKESEAKAAEFKRQQLLIKKDLVAALDKLSNEADNEEALVADLKQIQAVIAKAGGLPLGIKKEELYKIIRTKKAQGYWPTAVEVAYQSLKQEVSFQQSPNVEKDMGNFYQ